MAFLYSRNGLTGGKKHLQRALEIFPGALSWSILAGMSALSFFQPLIAAIIMIAFILFWVMRLFYMNIFLVISYIRLSVDGRTDWLRRVGDVHDPAACLKNIQRMRLSAGWKERISLWLLAQQMDVLIKSGKFPPLLEDIHHLVIIPVIKERRDIVEPGIKAMAQGTFSGRKVLIMIALEERASDAVKQDMAVLGALYRKDFMDLCVVLHPADLPGEARVKGANCTYAARQAADIFSARGIPFEHVLVSCFDADTMATPDYLSCLTFHYMVNPDRDRASYQPIPVYHNNIWEAPSFARVMEIGTSFFQMIESTNPRKLVTFSSHSMSFKALVDIGYWPVDMISDDSAVFWKAFIHYKGAYRVIPMYTTVSMDIVTGRDWKSTLVNIYKQKRRWAWGVENLPIVFRAFLTQPQIPFKQKLVHAVKLLDTFISWATWSILLAFVSWLPAVFSSREFETTTVYYTVPRIKGTIFALASVGVVVCMVLSLSLLPKEPSPGRLWRRVLHVFEWLFMPLFVLILSAFPALDAQTRLMFGKYMEFQVTEKMRRKGSDGRSG
ncbi:MAG: glycosyltransferase family 2 protein [Candidatus Omnitrophica bacterium]|nr:glycosyltransferase family 2 protein [Candidatus Omnitrophota bacterium]